MLKEYDIIVVGAGHAGNEAAASAAKMGSSVLLITMNMETIGLFQNHLYSALEPFLEVVF